MYSLPFVKITVLLIFLPKSVCKGDSHKATSFYDILKDTVTTTKTYTSPQRQLSEPSDKLDRKKINIPYNRVMTCNNPVIFCVENVFDAYWDLKKYFVRIDIYFYG